MCSHPVLVIKRELRSTMLKTGINLVVLCGDLVKQGAGDLSENTEGFF